MQLGSKDENFSKSLVDNRGFSSKLVIQVVQNQCFFFKTALVPKNGVKSTLFLGGHRELC